ncbi:MAG: redox-regulated ATPase YchF [Candidatus Levybacteria bacterium]|nr:redox-regulated ATPase YchF [Candidatus Levybacteria bacterium]
MNLSIGIVGLPNVGKSTLFNALLKRQTAFVANYPFATIEPNVGVVPVPDERLEKLAYIIGAEAAREKGPAAHSSQGAPASLASAANADARLGHPSFASPVLPPIIPATVKFIDIAGLVKGAAAGEGLGNKFLAHIREVDLICHVQRYFKDTNITHVTGEPKPGEDRTTVDTELILADLETLNKQQQPRMNATKEDLLRWEIIKKLKTQLDKGVLAKNIGLTEEEKETVKNLNLITLKPVFFIANVSEDDLDKKFPDDAIAVCAKTEAELADLSDEEQREYLKSLGLGESGLEKVIKKGYEMLDLISFLTCGEKEIRAWTIRRGSTALIASGTIHTDFMKKFIKAEVVSYEDFVASEGWKGAREKGKARLEGKDYIVKDGDVIEFKIGG